MKRPRSGTALGGRASPAIGEALIQITAHSAARGSTLEKVLAAAREVLSLGRIALWGMEKGDTLTCGAALPTDLEAMGEVLVLEESGPDRGIFRGELAPSAPSATSVPAQECGPLPLRDGLLDGHHS
jgi:hypothetical protein